MLYARRSCSVVVAALALGACVEPRPPAIPDVVDVVDTVDARPDGTAPDVPVMDAADAQEPRDVQPDAQDAERPDAPRDTFCALGTEATGVGVPAEFCVRRYARVMAARVMAFAPNGDLFVSSPQTGTPGGAPPGRGEVVVLTDDDHNGVAETHTYLADVPDVHGIAFGPGYFYFTTEREVYRLPYASGDRTTSAEPEVIARFTPGGVFPRWTHGLAVSVDGTIYTSQGNHGSTQCPPTEQDGAVQRIVPGTLAPETLAYGFRNPMYIRCHHTENVCLASELSDDGDGYGAPEKIIVVRPGSTYGYPCCVTTSVNSVNNRDGSRFNCSAAATAASTIPLHDTPFGLDWAPTSWPAPYANSVFIALHGSAYHAGNRGAAVQFAETSPLSQVPGEVWRNFIAYEARGEIARPTDVIFGPDGRLFLADDRNGQVYWIAPRALTVPPR